MKRPDFTKLSDREIKTFVHNAQLAIVENIDDSRIPAIAEYTRHVLKILSTETKFSDKELAAVFISVAWKLMNGGCMDGKSSGPK